MDRELLEDRAVEAGLHVATSVSRLTSLLVTNDPDSATSKTVKAASFGTAVIDEAAFMQLLQDVAPAGALRAVAVRSEARRDTPRVSTSPAEARRPHPVAHGTL